MFKYIQILVYRDGETQPKSVQLAFQFMVRKRSNKYTISPINNEYVHHHILCCQCRTNTLISQTLSLNPTTSSL